MDSCYTKEDFQIVTLKSLETNSECLRTIKDWIVSMTDSIDNEDGVDFWEWIESNNELSKNDSNNLLNTFFMFFRNDLHNVIGTGSIVADDRDMGKRLELSDGVWIGGINVHRDFRGQGIGTILFEYIDNFIQQTITKDLIVYLFTDNTWAKSIYKKYGFQSKVIQL